MVCTKNLIQYVHLDMQQDGVSSHGYLVTFGLRSSVSSEKFCDLKNEKIIKVNYCGRNNQKESFWIIGQTWYISEGVLAAPLPSIVRCRSCIAGGAERLRVATWKRTSIVLCVDFQGRMLLSVCSPFSHSFTNIIRRQSTIYRVKKMFEQQF